MEEASDAETVPVTAEAKPTTTGPFEPEVEIYLRLITTVALLDNKRNEEVR